MFEIFKLALCITLIEIIKTVEVKRTTKSLYSLNAVEKYISLIKRIADDTVEMF